MEREMDGKRKGKKENENKEMRNKRKKIRRNLGQDKERGIKCDIRNEINGIMMIKTVITNKFERKRKIRRKIYIFLCHDRAGDRPR